MISSAPAPPWAGSDTGGGGDTRVAIYSRVSTADQDNDNQLLRLRSWAEANGWEVYGEYIDIASGADQHRPSLDKMLADAKARRIDMVVAVKIDRLARSMSNLQKVMERLDSYGVAVRMLDQDIDTSSAQGRLLFTVLGAFAEFERELIRERTRDGLARARAQGRTLGRPRRELSAYQIDKAREIIAENPEISPTALAERFDGISPKTLIRLLREAGIIPPRP